MLNLIHANSQASLRGATLVATKQSCFCHPCESRYLDSRLRGNDNLQLLRRLTPSCNDASLVLENGRLLQSYGKNQGGQPITIGYNSNDVISQSGVQ